MIFIDENCCSKMEDVRSSLSSPALIEKSPGGGQQIHTLERICNSTTTPIYNCVRLNADEEEALLDRLCGSEDEENTIEELEELKEHNEHEFMDKNVYIPSDGEDAKEYTKDFMDIVRSYNQDTSYEEVRQQPPSTIKATSTIESSLSPAITNISLPEKTTPIVESDALLLSKSKELDKLTDNEQPLNGRRKNVGTYANARKRKTYICDVCHKNFGGNTDLKRHQLIHSNEKPFKCEQCDKCYRQAINLKNHITTAHARKKQYCCAECPKTFALKERLKLHMRLHSGEKPYACSLCDKRFARGGQLHQHTVSHHNDGPKRYRCDKCLERFSSASNLKAHKERHEHGPEHYCDICKEYFVNDVLLKTHLHKLHRKEALQCDICHETIEYNNFANHMKEHVNDKRHICHLCNTLFVQKSQYNVHMKMHSGERPYQCRICSQTFAHSSVLKLHIRKHTGEKPFRCLLCTDDEVAFSQLAHLKTHMKKIHNQSKPYLCEGCHEFFKVKVELEAHQYICAPYIASYGQRIQNDDRNSYTKETKNLPMPESHSNISKLKLDIGMQKNEDDVQILSDMRLHIAILLKKISSDQKLQQLGFEKRLIDNVVIASLKMAKRNVHTDINLTPIVRMRRNVEELLNWIVPPTLMEQMRQETSAIETILEKIVTNYIKQK